MLLSAKKIIFFALQFPFLISSVYASSSLNGNIPAPTPQPNTGVHFIFCSLINGNGCGAMAVASDNTTQQRPALLWGTSHSEAMDENFMKLDGLMGLMGITIISNYCYTNKSSIQICQFFENYSNQNWNTQTDYIASETDGSKLAYAIFKNQTAYSIKVNIQDHGNELFPWFYLNYDALTHQPSLAKYPAAANICLEKIEGDPSKIENSRQIFAFYTVENDITKNNYDDNDSTRNYFDSVEDLKSKLKNIGFIESNFKFN